ncbi:head-tail connector protein [Achromobacter mucicolens]|uniref:head-tail connector protein n=1 Tax=Achromobacter mucicolens TaxID=1389922 RepID=UPI00289F3AE1|nr:head-tail connector protein [Achromobacter mucicolens]
MDLALVKQHLRLNLSDATEDALIQDYIDSALAHVEQHCDRKIVDAPVNAGEMALTKDVEQAVKLLVGHWYSNREAAVVGAVSNDVALGVERLLWYRKQF